MDEKNTYVSQIKSDLEILAEEIREFWIKGQNVEQIVPVYLVQIAIGQRSHVARRFANGRIYARILPEYVVLGEYGHHDVALQYLYASSRYEVQGR